MKVTVYVQITVTSWEIGVCKGPLKYIKILDMIERELIFFLLADKNCFLYFISTFVLHNNTIHCD